MTMPPKFRTLVDVYRRSTERFATQPLFGMKQGGSWHWTTYAEFSEQVEACRCGLSQLKVGRGDRVALIANNRVEWAATAHAAFGLVATIVPMYESQLDKEWKYILRDCGAKVVMVANAEIAARVTAMRDDLPSLEHIVQFDGEPAEGALSYASLLEKGQGTPCAIVEPAPEDVCTFVYTSGTTGNPKGVMLTHDNLARNVSAFHEVFPLEPQDRSLSFLPWAHSFGQVVELHGLYSMGASMGIAESPDKIMQNLGEVRPTVLFSVPRVFNKIYDGLHRKVETAGGMKKRMFFAAVANQTFRKELHRKKRASGWADFKHSMYDKIVFQKVRDQFGGRLKYAFSGGAALNKHVAEFIDNLGILVYEGYGLTETSPMTSANWPGTRRIGSVGKPIPGVRVELDTSVTNDPIEGEIVVYGHNVMKGYHNLPEENAAVFTADGGFRTGDMGRMDDDGFLFITGRVKEQYKLENGKYVVPSPLEEQLKLSPYVANAMVFGDNKPYNVALIVPFMEGLEAWADRGGINAKGQALLDRPEVRQFLEDEIRDYSADFKQFEKVRKFAILLEDFTPENGLLTPSFKLKRREVIARYGDRISALYGA